MRGRIAEKRGAGSREIGLSARVQSAECRVKSAECSVQSAEFGVQECGGRSRERRPVLGGACPPQPLAGAGVGTVGEYAYPTGSNRSSARKT